MKSIGVRVGNWLTLRQAQTLLSAPDIAPDKGRRDRAILAVLLGCGLRRSEVTALTIRHIQQRDGRATAQTTERYLGTKQDLADPPNDAIKLKVVV